MENYLQIRQRLIRKALSMHVLDHLDRFSQFSFFSANLTNFMPWLAPAQHPVLFQEAFVNQQLSLLDDRYFTTGIPMPVHGWDSAIAPMLQDQPGIICTLHAGSYRILAYLLTVSRMPFAVLMAGKVANEQGAAFRARYAEWQERNGGALTLPIIPAEEPRGLWQALRLLRQGYHLLVYLDGFTGLPTDRDKNMQCLPFLGQHLYVRRGAAWLAQQAHVPLYAINNIRQADGSLLMMADEPIHHMEVSRHGGEDLAMSRMFAFFSKQIIQAPAQWENWFFLHFQLDVNRMTRCEPLSILAREAEEPNGLPDWKHYGLYRDGKRHYLLEKKGYQSYEMERMYFNRLWRYWKKQA